ncbi:hypothetical protein CEXT_58981 [Caerostris extrusa]|uniref:Uncharacterized protein n=1 Tax=Caerostris extrusa TaxID=172846 RepID=A0AAV4QWW8_CAEEX|nr:hypothetical protein CEXT_58981 [Caerostris extrusa]
MCAKNKKLLLCSNSLTADFSIRKTSFLRTCLSNVEDGDSCNMNPTRTSFEAKEQEREFRSFRRNLQSLENDANKNSDQVEQLFRDIKIKFN